MAYGNDNVSFITNYQYISYSSTSEQGAALDADTRVVDLSASTDAYVCIGTNPTAAAPSGEKVKTKSFKLLAGVGKTVAVPAGSDSAPIKIAVICSASDGTLEVVERTF